MLKRVIGHSVILSVLGITNLAIAATVFHETVVINNQSSSTLHFTGYEHNGNISNMNAPFVDIKPGAKHKITMDYKHQYDATNADAIFDVVKAGNAHSWDCKVEVSNKEVSQGYYVLEAHNRSRCNRNFYMDAKNVNDHKVEFIITSRN